MLKPLDPRGGYTLVETPTVLSRVDHLVIEDATDHPAYRHSQPMYRLVHEPTGYVIMYGQSTDFLDELAKTCRKFVSWNADQPIEEVARASRMLRDELV